MILCVAGDPGGSRAVLPIARELFQMGRNVVIPAHGILGKELPAEMQCCLCSESDTPFLARECGALVFGSSASDPWPLAMARIAKSGGAKVMHVLDNWSSYKRRLQTDGRPPLFPDIYTVIDEEAFLAAVNEGIAAQTLFIIGQPAFSQFAKKVEDYFAAHKPCPAFNDLLKIAFVHEPYSKVFGADPCAPGHPGFNEQDVLKMAAESLRNLAPTAKLDIIKHPKQDISEIETDWKNANVNLECCVKALAKPEDIFYHYNGIIGMGSILLYNAWLAGTPVISLQPNCRNNDIKRYGHFDGIFYADNYEALNAEMSKWLDQCKKPCRKPRPELSLHMNAARNAANALLKYMEKSR